VLASRFRFRLRLFWSLSVRPSWFAGRWFRFRWRRPVLVRPGWLRVWLVPLVALALVVALVVFAGLVVFAWGAA
jgi:hypothetical protein